jgi:hypothetical protein
MGSVLSDQPIGRDVRGSKNPRWKGGRTTDGHGRVLIRQAEHPFANSWGYVYRYRLVVEKRLGRYLKSNEIVHHIDGDCSNDADSNLELTTQSAHIKKHLPEMHNDAWVASLSNHIRNNKGQFVS